MYRQHYGFVQSTLARFGVPQAAVDDVTQTVFISVFRNLDNLEPAASVRAFLYGFARGTAANYRKKSWREQRKIRELGWASGSESRDGGVERLAARHTIDGLLARLTQAQRDVFVLSELWDMKSPEIAQALDVDPSTVRTRLRAARQIFRRHAAAISGESPSAVRCDQWLSVLVPAQKTTEQRCEHGYLALLAALAASPDLLDDGQGSFTEPAIDVPVPGPTRAMLVGACTASLVAAGVCWYFTVHGGDDHAPVAAPEITLSVTGSFEEPVLAPGQIQIAQARVPVQNRSQVDSKASAAKNRTAR